ncbi:hypothetical protein C900_05310 [Fulvivirga imtechensis AK7]|uniref:Uncharacterized protein n=1 Tax=Fulvivirga imtechensis AK7 TaxID=1237149 RepID=L8JP26_9BACT|nr:hypothetical protein [Fulvivirga imtechensis]ELR69239.1 hypothetical protein C900_05310 [Fulvivirga imtechensis AK7]
MRKLVALYKKYKDYVRVDLLMYGVMILMIIAYFVYEMITA